MKPYHKKKYFLYAVILFSILVFSGCEQQKQTTTETPLRYVRSIVVSSGTGNYARSFSGTLHASQETNLSFKVSGLIQKIYVDVGDDVKANDTLAILDATPYRLEAEQAQASLVQAKAELRNKKANYERTKNLYEGGNVSRKELDSARAASASAIASVQSARKAVEIALLNVSYTKLHTEDDCAIASIDAETGENTSSGVQVFHAICGKGLEVKLNIPETIISSIKKGMQVEVSFPALDGKIFKAKVNEVGVSTVQGGSTFPITVIITEPQKSNLKAGLSANVAFSIENLLLGKTAILVPPFAIAEDQIGRYVFILEKSQEDQAIVRRQPVKIGAILQNGIEVLDGLQADMRVVTAGVSVLRDGMKVKYADE